jgi:tRNA (mo5U34)-methyltransferase
MEINIQQLIDERKKSFFFKNLIHRKTLLDAYLKKHSDTPVKVTINDTISIKGLNGDKEDKELLELLEAMKPWRKGPFEFFNYFVDTEWKSFIKYNIIKPYLDIENKTVIDVGCNNGYYLFKMLELNPRRLIGIDPSSICNLKFEFANAFIKSSIEYYMLGIEHMPQFVKYRKIKVDMILCLGVLYHRSDPIGSLKALSNAIKKGGTLILDSFIIDGDEDVALTPRSTYSKIPNIYFIPTINALTNWLLRSGFEDIKVINTNTTTKEEQRVTKWIDAQSLEHFIDEDTGLTVEQYPRPKRGYIICKKK